MLSGGVCLCVSFYPPHFWSRTLVVVCLALHCIALDNDSIRWPTQIHPKVNGSEGENERESSKSRIDRRIG